MMSMKLLGRKDPQGYYVIPAKRKALEYLKTTEAVIIEEAGNLVFFKTKSRSLAKKIASKLQEQGLLAI